MNQVFKKKNGSSEVVKKGGTEESCEGCSQRWSYQCNECDYAAVKREELKSHVEAVHRDGVQHLLYLH